MLFLPLSPAAVIATLAPRDPSRSHGRALSHNFPAVFRSLRRTENIPGRRRRRPPVDGCLPQAISRPRPVRNLGPPNRARPAVIGRRCGQTHGLVACHNWGRRNRPFPLPKSLTEQRQCDFLGAFQLALVCYISGTVFHGSGTTSGTMFRDCSRGAAIAKQRQRQPGSALTRSTSSHEHYKVRARVNIAK
jgi:hypothetical protein